MMEEHFIFIGKHITDIKEMQCAFPLIPFLCMATATIGAWFFSKLWGTTPTKKTKSVIILGRKASGKTTLWSRLKNYEFSKEYITTSTEKIEKFHITRDGKTVLIQSTKDIGGDDLWVTEYEELIKEGTFILFLVDATDLTSDAKECIRCRIQKIQRIIHDNKIKDVGFRIYITHSDEYLSKSSNTTKAQLIENIKNFLDLATLKTPEKVKYEYTSVDLSCDKDIDCIKKEIIDSVYE